MDLQSIFAYGLIFVFFIALFVLSPLVVPPTESPQDAAKIEVSEARSPSKTSKLAYGLVAGIFMLLAVLTFLSHKGPHRNSS